MRTLGSLKPFQVFLAAWVGLFYLAPILLAVATSLATPRLYGGVDWRLTFSNYSYVKPDLFLRTTLFAAATAVASTALALALSIDALVFPSAPKRALIAGLSTFSLVTNSLLKIMAWVLLLGSSGPLGFGLFSDPNFAVLIGLFYMYLPVAILVVFDGVRSIDPGLIRAARDLGATRVVLIRRLLLPLARPFALRAALVVFVFVFADFLVPQVLGDGKVMLTGNRMSDLFEKHFQAPASMAIGTVIVALLSAALLFPRKEATAG